MRPMRGRGRRRRGGNSLVQIGKEHLWVRHLHKRMAGVVAVRGDDPDGRRAVDSELTAQVAVGTHQVREPALRVDHKGELDVVRLRELLRGLVQVVLGADGLLGCKDGVAVLQMCICRGKS